jgi:selenocysteine lyase/cysteine desulfurase
MGERNDFVTVPMTSLALEQILEWGVTNIQAYIANLTGLIAGQALERGWEVVPQPLRVGHIIGLQKKGANLGEIAAKLAQNQVHASVRGTVLRLSPHVYNTTAEVATFFKVLDGVK